MENKSRKCIIYGAGFFGEYIQEAVCEYGYEIVAYCDVRRRGKLGTHEILSVERAIQICEQDEDVDIIIGVKTITILKEIEEIIKNRFPKKTSYKFGMNIYSDIQERQLAEYYKNMSYKWDVNLKDEFLLWIDNIYTEIEYWVKDVADIRGVSNVHNERCRNNHLFSHHLLAESLEEGNIVLDIGCGLVSPFGEILPNGKRVHLIPVDALASYYNRINACINDGKKEDYECHFGMFEFMAYIFAENYADAIIINNALDHCIDPFRSLVECLFVLKENGELHLSHRRAEAVYEKWSGLHRWNIDYIEEKLVFWNKENAININDILSDYVDINITYNDVLEREEQNIRVKITKKKSFSLREFVDVESDANILAACVKTLMEKQAKDCVYFETLLTDARF